MVTQNTLRTRDENKLKFAIHADVNKCLQQAKFPSLVHKGASKSELPSNTSTMAQTVVTGNSESLFFANLAKKD